MRQVAHLSDERWRSTAVQSLCAFRSGEEGKFNKTNGKYSFQVQINLNDVICMFYFKVKMEWKA